MLDSKLLVFDLDGTLVKSDDTIYLSMMKAFEFLNINSKIDRQKFNDYIGWHFQDIFDVFKIEVGDLDAYIEVYKSFYNDLLHTSSLYDGVESTLSALMQNNKIALLTTKMQDQAENILNYFDLTKYFDLILGRGPGFEHKPSPQPLLYIVEQLNYSIDNTYIIGDTELDIRCGKNAKTNTIAVTYGFRTASNLALEKPDYTINNFKDLMSL